MRSHTRSAWATPALVLLLVSAPAATASAQHVSSARAGIEPSWPSAADTVPSTGRAGLPPGVQGGLVGALLGAATGAVLSFAAHQMYCAETSSCGEYPDRSFRDATLAGAAIGLLLGIGIEEMIIDRRGPDRAR